MCEAVYIVLLRKSFFDPVFVKGTLSPILALKIYGAKNNGPVLLNYYTSVVKL